MGLAMMNIGDKIIILFWYIVAMALVLLIAWLFFGGTAALGQPVSIEARVVAVIDGDTIEAEALIWDGLKLTTRVRLLGIDTPEMRGACNTERTLAVKARQRVIALSLGKTVTLSAIKPDKYAGRIDAQVRLPDGHDLSGLLVLEGLARPYTGGQRGAWCP